MRICLSGITNLQLSNDQKRGGTQNFLRLTNKVLAFNDSPQNIFLPFTLTKPTKLKTTKLQFKSARALIPKKGTSSLVGCTSNFDTAVSVITSKLSEASTAELARNVLPHLITTARG